MLWTTKTLQITVAYQCNEGQCLRDPWIVCREVLDRNVEIDAIRLNYDGVLLKQKFLRKLYVAVQGKRRMENTEQSRSVPALPVCRCYRKGCGGQGTCRVGNNEVPRRIMDFKLEGCRRVGR